MCNTIFQWLRPSSPALQSSINHKDKSMRTYHYVQTDMANYIVHLNCIGVLLEKMLADIYVSHIYVLNKFHFISFSF